MISHAPLGVEMFKHACYSMESLLFHHGFYDKVRGDHSHHIAMVKRCQWLPVIVTFLYLRFSSSGFSLQQVRYGTQALQQGDLVKPDGSTNYRGVVMLIHGGFWKASYDRSLMIEIADDLVAQNFCVWNVDYRSAAWCKDIFFFSCAVRTITTSPGLSQMGWLKYIKLSCKRFSKLTGP